MVSIDTSHCSASCDWVRHAPIRSCFSCLPKFVFKFMSLRYSLIIDSKTEFNSVINKERDIMLNALEVLGSIKRVRSVLTVVGTLHSVDDMHTDTTKDLEGVLMVLEAVNEDLRGLEMELVKCA